MGCLNVQNLFGKYKSIHLIYVLLTLILNQMCILVFNNIYKTIISFIVQENKRSRVRKNLKEKRDTEAGHGCAIKISFNAKVGTFSPFIFKETLDRSVGSFLPSRTSSNT